MRRTPEPELMDDAAQARAYADADFSVPHAALVARFATCFPDARPRRIVDLGCGPGDVSARIAALHPGSTVVGVDGAVAMLREGRRLLACHAAGARVTLVAGMLPATPLRPRIADAVVSNSLLHHLRDPAVLWHAVAVHGAPDALVFVADLRRPATPAAADALVAAYAAREPAVLREDFRRSLHAAYEPDEVAAQLAEHGLAGLAVEALGDRHLVVWGRLG